MREFKTLIDGLSFTECPRWRDGRLYFSDFYTHRVLAVDLRGKVEEIAAVPNQPAGLGWLPDGRMLIVSMRDRKVLLREGDGTLVVHADLSVQAPWHCNDMLVDPRGYAWVGNFGFDLHGGGQVCNTVLICVDPDGTARIAAEDLGFPNGMAITRDGRTLIVAETTCNRLSAFPVDRGTLGERRIWAKFDEPPGSNTVPAILGEMTVAADGICLDAEGAVWLADALHGRLLRVTEGGRILEELPVGAGLNPYACALGGEDGRTLFVCAAPTFAEAEASQSRNASIQMTRVDVPAA